MKLIIIAILLLLSIPAAASITKWYNYEEGMVAAGSLQKPVILDFYADWCGPCVAMEEGTYPDPRVVSELADFVAIKVDTQKRIDIESKYGIAYYPTVVFLDTRGKEISRHIGYLGPEEMIVEIKQSRGKLPKESPGFETLFILFAFIGVMLAVTHRHVCPCGGIRQGLRPLRTRVHVCQCAGIRVHAIDWRDSRRGCALQRRDSGRLYLRFMIFSKLKNLNV